MRNCYTPSFLKSFLLLLTLVAVSVGKLDAQTTITTTHTNGNGSSMITFNVRNNNATTPIIITTVACALNTSTSNAWEVLYNPTAIASSGATWTQGNIGAGQNGWVSAGTGTAANTTGAVVTLSSTLSITIPGGQTYGIAVSATSVGYMTLTAGAGVNTFSGGGVDLLTGDNISWGGAIAPAIPVNYPRGFVGSITFIPALPCTTPPTPGTVTSSVANPVCTYTSFILSLTGGTSGTGQTYQWQSSLSAAGPWGNAPGTSTNSTYSNTQTTNTYYRCQVTCGASTVSSAAYQVISTTCAPAYCTPTYSTGNTAGDYLTLVQITGTTLNNATGQLASPYYFLYPQSGSTTCTLIPGVTYTMVVSPGTYTSNDIAAWLDYNLNGTFESSELLGSVYNVGAGPTTQTFTFTVPLSAPAGTMRLRVREADQATTTLDPCAALTFGETEDYDITIASLVPCTGTPVAGAAASSNTNVTCAGTPITLSLTGSGINAGLTYQWQSATAVGGPYTNISGATAFTYTTVQTLPTVYYQCVVTCTATSASSTSTPILVTAASGPSYATLPYVESFETAWINGCNTADIPNNYWKNTPATGNTSWRREDDAPGLNTGAWGSNTLGAYTPAASDGSHSARFHSYQSSSGTSGTLDVYLNCNTVDVTKKLEFDVINTSGTDTLTVFVSTDAGLTFTRLDSAGVSTAWRTKTLFFNSTSATTVVRFKVTSDFGVTDFGVDNLKINNYPNCSGTPVAGTATSTTTNITCPGAPFTLNLTGSTVAGGLSYQWQSATSAAGPWGNIAGATTMAYTTTQSVASLFYHCVVTCVVGPTNSTSTFIQVLASPPSYATIPYAESFESAWVNNCGISDAPNFFWKNTPVTGNTSWRREDDATANGNTAAWGSPTLGPYAPAASAGNHSARFHSYQATSGTSGTLDLYINCNTTDITKKLVFDCINTSGTDTVSIMLSTDGGVTFSRIDSTGIATAWRTKTIYFNSTSATTIIRFKATSDFGVTDIGIDNLILNNFPNCSGAPLGGTATSSQTTIVCPGSPFTLNLLNSSVAGGLAYQWQSATSAAGPWNPISGATTIPYTTTQAAATMFYRCVVTCTLSSTSSNSTAVQVNSSTGPSYAALPFIEDFENVWINGCGIADIPNIYWKNTPITGNTSWRREDDAPSGGNTAVWGSPTLGSYTPSASTGFHSARFHTYQATSGTTGTMDLYLNCLTAQPLKRVLFDYINTSGTDVDSVFFSKDGGTTFTFLDTVGVSTVWATRTVFFASQSATTILRFKGRSDFGVTDIGLDNIHVDGWGDCSGTPNAGTAVANPASNACASIPVTLTANNASVGNGIIYQWQSASSAAGPWTDIANATNPTAVVTQLVTTYYRCVVKCILTNTSANSTTVNVTSPALPGGNYTINSAQPTAWSGATGNFNSFNDAYTAIKCGITSSVVFSVLPGANAGIYNEQLVMSGAIPNASATRTVTFKGNGQTLKFQSANTNERAAIKLRSIKYITFDSLRIDVSGGTYGFGVHITADADSNTVKKCTIITEPNTFSTNFAGIAISGSDASATGTGTTTALCDYNIIDSNRITGGYYGITLAATFTGGAHGNNKITNNRIEDFYLYGIYVSGTFSTTISANRISRPSRISSALTTFYGIYFPAQSNDANITKNRIYNPFGADLANTNTFYGIYLSGTATSGFSNVVSNNLIYGVNGNGAIYALYNTGAGNVIYTHNTISLDSLASASTGITRGYYQLGTSNGVYFYNNLISITRGGTAASTKHCVYVTTPFVFADNNNYYMNSAAGTNKVGFYTADRATILDWKTAVQPFGLDQAAISTVPIFADPSYAVADYHPGNAGMDNKGLYVGVTTDITGAARSLTTPDIGAYEFVPSPCTLPLVSGATTISATTICQNQPVVLGLNIGAFGGGQTFQWQVSASASGPFTLIGSPMPYPDTTILASVTQYYQCIIKCGSANTVSNAVLLTVNPALPAGTYTINSALATTYPATGNNFASFNAAKAAMSCGVTGTGNIIFNVQTGENAGVYTEQLKLDTIYGVNANRQIIFNGNGNTIAFSSSNSAERAVIKLNSTDYITFDSLVINSIGSGTYGHGVQLINNADSNTFRKCTILASQTAAQSTTNYAAVVINSTDASATTATTGITQCDGNLFDRDTISGGYYGVTLMGGATALVINNNRFTNNTIKDFYTYGMYIVGTYNTLIEANTFTRPTRASVITAYPIYLTSVASTRMSISKNRITKLYGGAPTSTAGIYGIYHNNVDALAGNEVIVSNNLLYNLDGLGPIYGLYNLGSDNIFYFHNTISIENPTANATATVGFYQSTDATGVQFMNNIVTIRRASTGVKQGIYLGSTTTDVTSNYNDILVGGVGTTNYFGTRGTTNYSTLAAWQAGTAKDANSYSQDPLYQDTLNGNYKPLLASIDNKGSALAGILTDITNANRSLFTPDLGAYEFAPIPCTAPPVAGTATVTPNAGICLETPIRLTLTGTSALGNITFQWQTSTTGGAPWTNIGPLSYSPTFDTAASISRFYRCLVTCNGNTTVSSTTFVTLGALLPGGTYTINGTLPQSNPPYTPGVSNFSTVQNAVNAVLCGVTGSVVFNVNGTFTEQIRIPYVPGTNANTTITFQSYNGLPSGAQLTYNSTGAANNYTLKLDSCKYFTFRNMTLAATNTTNSRVVEFANTASYDSLSRCVVNTPVTTSTANTAAAVYANGLTGINNIVKGNTVNNGSTGIYFSGTSTAVPLVGQLIDSNFVSGASTNGIYTTLVQKVKLTRNTVNITSPAAATTVYGINATDCDSSYQISNNKVNISSLAGTVTAYGVYVNNCDGSSLNRGKLTGNDVVATTSNAGIIYGLWIGGATGSPYIDVLNNTAAINTTAASSYGLYNSNSANGNYYNNSINSTATSATNNYAAYFGNTTAAGLTIKNNIFSHKAGGKALFISVPTNVISNYNMLYTSGATLVERGTPSATYATLGAWNSTVFQDQFSMVYSPAFISSSDLRPDLANPDVWAIHGRGVQIVENTYDHDNAPRPTTLLTGVPDLGAYEFYPTALPTVLTATPATPAANTEQTFMYGTDTVMKLKWGAVAPPNIQVRRYSGVVPTGLAAANLDSMYFYTKVDIPGNGNYDYDAKLFYWDPWLGSIGGLTSGVYQLGLGKTTASFGTPWVVGFTSRNDVPKRMIYQTALTAANLDRFTGLINPYAPPVLPDQDSSNVGKRFWVAYPINQLAGGQDMVLYLSTQGQPANVQVKIGGTTYVRNYTIPANTVFSTGSVPDLMPKTGPTSAYLATAGVFDQGISIVSDVPIVAYAHTYGSASSGATMLMPVGTWGYQYKTLCIAGSANFSDSRPFFVVIADNDNTTVDVTPSGPVANAGMSANATTSVTLNKGQVLLVIGTSATEDLTGSVVKASSNTAGKCYPVAVFSGNSRLSMNISGVNSGGDFTIQQNFPSTAWGKHYLTAPTSASNSANTFSTNVYRVAVKDPTTVVLRNGIPLSPLYNNHYYEYTSNTADYIEADKPVMVAQFTGDGTVLGNSGSVGDPEMMYISPIEQRIKSVGFYRNTLQNIVANLFTMIIPTNGLASLQMFDGATAFTADYVYPHPQNGNPSLKGVNYSVVVKRWTSAQQQVRVQSDSAFTGITYGLGSVESYGYNMGTLIKNLGVVGDTLINGVTGNLYNCVGTPFKFKVKTPVIPTSMTWKFSQVPFLTPHIDVTVTNPVPSGTVIINGETYYQFTLNQFYTFTQPGLYQVPVVITHPDIESCDHTLTSIVYVQVIPAPAIGFQVTFAGCQGNTALFTADNATSGGIGVNTWNWTFNNLTTATGPTATFTYPNAGTFTDSLHVVTSDGCIRDTARQTVVNPRPVVSMATDSVAICTGASATLTVQGPLAGATYNWYTTATGGTVLYSGTSHAFNNVTADSIRYVEGVSSFGCISTVRKRVIVHVLAPLAPVTVSVTGSTANTVTFSWTAITGATYQVSTTGASGPWVTPSSGATGLTHTVTGLGILTNTSLTVQAIGIIPCQTSTSPAVSGCTDSPPVITPDSVAICTGGTYTYLVNTPLPANVVYNWYTVPTAGTALTTGTAYTINASGSSFTANSLSPAAVYSYYAGHLNTVTGCAGSTRKKVVINVLAPLAKPVVPVPAFTAITPTSITFSWSAVPGAVGGYQVSINNGVSWTTPSTGANGLSHTVSGLAPNTSVTILVRALGYLACQTSISDPTTAKTYTDAVYVPNAFNPGSNMTSVYGTDNRVLRVYGYVIQSMQFMVFNQWGEKVFESTNQNSGWDGTYKGKGQPSGVYIYLLRFTTTTGETKEMKGSVSLIR